MHFLGAEKVVGQWDKYLEQCYELNVESVARTHSPAVPEVEGVSEVGHVRPGGDRRGAVFLLPVLDGDGHGSELPPVDAASVEQRGHDVSWRLRLTAKP